MPYSCLISIAFVSSFNEITLIHFVCPGDQVSMMANVTTPYPNGYKLMSRLSACSQLQYEITSYKDKIYFVHSWHSLSLYTAELLTSWGSEKPQSPTPHTVVAPCTEIHNELLILLSSRLGSLQRLFFLCPTFSSFYHTELKALLLIYLLVWTPKKLSIVIYSHSSFWNRFST